MKISVVTISFNQKEFLERTIRSVAAQTYRDFEYIIVDPGSTDGSRELIEAHRDHFAHIIFEKDRGPADGLNMGFARATGDIYFYLNSDDTITPDAFQTAVDAFRADPNADVLCGNAWIVDGDDRRLRRAWSDPYNLRAAGYGQCIVIQPSTYIRASRFKAIGGFNGENRSSWDGELIVDLALSGARVKRLNAFISHYRLHGASITGTGSSREVLRENEKRTFRKVIGREPNRLDPPLRRLYWLRRKVVNAPDALERVLRGRIFMRDLATSGRGRRWPLVFQAAIMPLPWRLRRKLLNAILGYDIADTARIGLSLVEAREVILEGGASIRHFTVVKSLSRLRLGEQAIIGNSNWISAHPLENASSFADAAGRDPSLEIQRHAALTNKHLVDCTDKITIGPFSTFGGWGSQILTHSIDIATNRQTCAPVTIGSYCFVGTRSVLLKSASLADGCVLSAGSVLSGPSATATSWCRRPGRPGSGRARDRRLLPAHGRLCALSAGAQSRRAGFDRAQGPRRTGDACLDVCVLGSPSFCLGACRGGRVASGRADCVRPWAARPRADGPERDAVRRNPGPVTGGPGLKGRTGWFEFDFRIPADGWYRLVTETEGAPHWVEFLIDPDRGGGTRVRSSEPWSPAPTEIGQVWLTAGRHSLRVQQYFWTGLPAFKSMALAPVPRDGPPSFRVASPFMAVYAKGRCEPIAVEIGGLREPGTIFAAVQRGNMSAGQRTTSVPPTAGMTRATIAPPCDAPGDYTVQVRTNGSNRRPVHIRYAVFDTAPVEPSYDRGRLVQEIAATEREPDYASDPARTETGAAGPARVTGKRGLTALARRQSTAPASWFAYRLQGLAADKPYFLEVEYPDDAKRAFTVSVRERGQTSYPVSMGVETGLEWPLLNKLASSTTMFWGRSPDPRVAIVNIHDGVDAAVSRIRVYEAVRTDRPAAARPPGLREFAIWNEEGDNLLDSVGMRERPAEMFEGVDRWMSSARDVGATVAIPTAVIYDSALYPTRFHHSFANPERDLVRGLLLSGERYGIGVIAELHPRADELAWVEDGAALRSRLALSKNGETNMFGKDGQRRFPPVYNALDPGVQDWYLGAIGELVDRYKDAPNFKGVSLRMAIWSNPALNNLGSLDWGYDARTVAAFLADKRIQAPELSGLTADDAAAARARFAFLTSRQHRESWIAWRCEKIADLFRRIRDRVRAARPDLVLYAPLNEYNPQVPPGPREAGIDINLLKSIDGVRVIDEQRRYGRKESSDVWARNLRDFTLIREAYDATRTATSGPLVLTPMHYIEAPGRVLPPDQLGLPTTVKIPWTSTASNPPGRLSAERYAVALGLGDAAWLGNGGNSNNRETPAASALLKEFTLLPAAPFTRVADAPDSVAVWQRDGYAYAVNLQPYRLSAGLHLSDKADPVRLASGRRVPVREGVLDLELDGYELAAFRLGGGSVSKASATIPDSEAKALERRITARETFHRDTCGSAASASLKGACDAYGRSLGQIRTAFAASRLWEAGRQLSSARLLREETALGRPDLDETAGR
jgi:glycosyltransferase involved in cell wall biosynthesis/acetyltransferase-like isoleucine patch superfamily enzyme